LTEAYPVTEETETRVCILREGIRSGPILPASDVLQCLRQIPVEQCDHGLDPGIKQRVDQTVVEIYTRLVGHVSGPPRENSWPRYRQSVCADLK